ILLLRSVRPRDVHSFPTRRSSDLPTKFRQIAAETLTHKARRNSRSDLGHRAIGLLRCVAENMPNLFFHAATVTFCQPLQAGFHVFLDISNYQLGHDLPQSASIS